MQNETLSAAELLTKLKAERAERERQANPTRLALIARLVDRHGLTEQQATTALDSANAGVQNEHSGLVAHAMLAMFTEQWGQIWQAVQPALQVIGQAVQAAMRATQDAYALLPAAPESAMRCSDNPTCDGGCCAKADPEPHVADDCRYCGHLRSRHSDDRYDCDVEPEDEGRCDCERFREADRG